MLKLAAATWAACSGIMNGLDTEEWDPSRDALLPPGARFAGHADAARGKSFAKHALQTRTGLRADTSVRPLHCCLPMAAPLACVGLHISSAVGLHANDSSFSSHVCRSWQQQALVMLGLHDRNRAVE